MESLMSSFMYQQSFCGAGLTRGYYRIDDSLSPIAFLSSMYTAVQPNRIKANEFLMNMIKYMAREKSVNHFDSSIYPQELAFVLYLSDNIAHLPFKIMDEVLNVVYWIDSILAIQGDTALSIIESVLEDGCPFNESLHYTSYLCVLLLILKNHLKSHFKVSDVKCHNFVIKSTIKSMDKTTLDATGVYLYDTSKIESLIHYEPTNIEILKRV